MRETSADEVDDFSRASVLSPSAWTGAAAIAALELAFSISLASLVFSGPLAAGAGRASASFIMGTAIVATVIGFTSRIRGVVASTQDAPAVVAAAVAASLAASTTSDAALPTAFVMLAIAVVLTGIIMAVVGMRRLTSLARFLPFPVTAAFVAGTGWLLIVGGISTMLGEPLELHNLELLVQWDTLRLLLPGIGLGLVVTAFGIFGWPGQFLGLFLLMFWAGFQLIGRSISSIAGLEDGGWLLGPFPDGTGWSPLTPSDLANADWGAIASHTLPVVALVLVSVVATLLNLAGLEVNTGADIEMDREFERLGGANVTVGLLGGGVGFHMIGATGLARTVGASSRLCAMLMAAASVGVLIAGVEVLGHIPRSLAGGVLIGIGLGLIYDWAKSALPSMGRSDQLLSFLILAAIAGVGILQGVAAGVLIASAIFVVRYSRTEPVRYLIKPSGVSTVERSKGEAEWLARVDGRTTAVALQGYLFFGSVRKLREVLDGGIELDLTDDSIELELPTFLIVDFGRVTGIDTSALAFFVRTTRRLEAAGITVVWCALSSTDQHELERAGAVIGTVHEDFDHATAWCEEQLLQLLPAGDRRADEPSFSPALLERMEARWLEAGERLFQQGEAGDELFFVESGSLTAWLELGDGRRSRVRRFAPGSVVGELAFVTGADRSAGVSADVASRVYVLRRAEFEAMRSTDTEAAFDVQQLLLGRVADRLITTTDITRQLLR